MNAVHNSSHKLNLYIKIKEKLIVYEFRIQKMKKKKKKHSMTQHILFFFWYEAKKLTVMLENTNSSSRSSCTIDNGVMVQ